jgi:hypothetical protein
MLAFGLFYWENVVCPQLFRECVILVAWANDKTLALARLSGIKWWKSIVDAGV